MSRHGMQVIVTVLDDEGAAGTVSFPNTIV
jgi:hypothetical protein